MDQWLEIRKRVLREGISQRQIIRETGIHWRTLKKILQNPKPPGYVRTKPVASKIDPYLDRIREILRNDKSAPQKQRHTAKRIWQVLQKEGFAGGYTIVKDAVRELRRTSQEVFVPLKHPPGEAQVDFGQAVVKMGGVLRKVVFFVMALPYSDCFFVKAYDRECTETFWDGHVQAFKFFCGVPRRITYDNSRIAISKIIGSRERKLTDAFNELVSHYLFDHHFCLVRRANEKGVVEGLVKFTRLNFMVPVPQVRDFEQLNNYLAEMCNDDMRRIVRGQDKCKEELLREESVMFLPRPLKPLDACRKQPARVNCELLVRFNNNDYSVPFEYAYQDVVVKGYVDKVVICRFNDVIAVHKRCWEREKQIFDPVHYLPLLERKPHCLPFAKPFENFKLPGCFEVLHDRMKHCLDNATREYIRVLRLLEKYDLRELSNAVEKALRIRAVTSDAVKQLLPGRTEFRRSEFRLASQKHLRLVQVSTSDVKEYGRLMGNKGGAA